MPQGVPSFGKFGAKRRKAYLEALGKGNSFSTAAVQAGVSYELVRLYRNATPGFAELEADAQGVADDIIEDAAHAAAVAGNVKAIEFWLTNRRPDRWKKQQTVYVDVDALDSYAQRIAAEIAARRSGAVPTAPGGSDPGPDGEGSHLNGTAG